jgi:hypothetical protein
MTAKVVKKTDAAGAHKTFKRAVFVSLVVVGLTLYRLHENLHLAKDMKRGKMSKPDGKHDNQFNVQPMPMPAPMPEDAPFGYDIPPPPPRHGKK